MKTKFEILIIDDHEIVRFGMVQVLQQKFIGLKISESSDANSALNLLKDHDYDLIISDLNLPDISSHELIKALRKVEKNTPIIVFSMFPKEVMENAMSSLNIQKYVHKGDGLQILTEAVFEIMGNIENGKKSKKIKSSSDSITPFEKLSAKELEVMMLYLQGKSTTDICGILTLKPSTVSTYKARIFIKLEVTNIAALTKLAFYYNVITSM
jgi:two-component system invasion response regulator UvrY